MAGALRDCEGIFPPMVISLINDGETFGVLDQTARMAGQWLRDGRYETDRGMFASGGYFVNRVRDAIKQAIARPACEIIIDGTKLAPPPGRAEPQLVWIELVTDEEKRERLSPVADPRQMSLLDEQLKAFTVLDRLQEGDSMTGTLRIRMDPEDRDEAHFPIRYRPLPDGEEIRIHLGNSESTATSSPR